MMGERRLGLLSLACFPSSEEFESSIMRSRSIFSYFSPSSDDNPIDLRLKPLYRFPLTAAEAIARAQLAFTGFYTI